MTFSKIRSKKTGVNRLNKPKTLYPSVLQAVESQTDRSGSAVGSVLTDQLSVVTDDSSVISDHSSVTSAD